MNLSPMLRFLALSLTGLMRWKEKMYSVSSSISTTGTKVSSPLAWFQLPALLNRAPPDESTSKLSASDSVSESVNPVIIMEGEHSVVTGRFACRVTVIWLESQG